MVANEDVFGDLNRIISHMSYMVCQQQLEELIFIVIKIRCLRVSLLKIDDPKCCLLSELEQWRLARWWWIDIVHGPSAMFIMAHRLMNTDLVHLNRWTDRGQKKCQSHILTKLCVHSILYNLNIIMNSTQLCSTYIRVKRRSKDLIIYKLLMLHHGGWRGTADSSQVCKDGVTRTHFAINFLPASLSDKLYFNISPKLNILRWPCKEKESFWFSCLYYLQ